MFKSYLGRIVSGFLLAAVVISGCGSTDNSDVTIYVVRHGKTMLNTTHRVQGWADAVLTRQGEQVVDWAGIGMKDIKFTAVWSSDSGRAIQTANRIMAKNTQGDVPLQTDWRLREFNFGSYEGDLNNTMWSDIAASKGMTLEEWMQVLTPEAFANAVAELDKARTTSTSPDENWPAEDYAAISARLRDGLNNVVADARRKGGGDVLLVSHGLSIGAMVTMLNPALKTPKGGFKNASVTKIVYKNGKYEIDGKDIDNMDFMNKGKASGE